MIKSIKLPGGSLTAGVSQLTGFLPERIEELGGASDWDKRDLVSRAKHER